VVVFTVLFDVSSLSAVGTGEYAVRMVLLRFQLEADGALDGA
jgi:hypothetical protein